MSIEIMKQALEALGMLARYENPETKIQVRKPKDGGPIVTMYPHKVATEAATALRLAIEQAEKQEPMAWMENESFVDSDNLWDVRVTFNQDGSGIPLYTAPPQRQPLTEEEMLEILVGIDAETKRLPPGMKAFARAIERAHGIGGKE
jgi:hypothetical protein